jgi:hypothetical protein
MTPCYGCKVGCCLLLNTLFLALIGGYFVIGALFFLRKPAGDDMEIGYGANAPAYGAQAQVQQQGAQVNVQPTGAHVQQYAPPVQH